MAEREMVPVWLKTLQDHYLAGTNMFILHFNIRDYVFLAGDPPAEIPELLPLADYLKRRWLQIFDIVLYYSRSSGIVHVGGDDLELEVPVMVKPGDGNRLDRRDLFDRIVREAIDRPFNLREDQTDLSHFKRARHPTEALPFLERLLTHSFLPRPLRQEGGETGASAAKGVSPQEAGQGFKGPERVRIALIIDFLENIAPVEGMRVQGHDVSLAIETLKRWAGDPRIGKNNHLIVMLTSDLGNVDPSLYAGASGIIPIKVDYPDRDNRRAFLAWLKDQGEISSADIDVLSAQTAGFNLSELHGLARYARALGEEPGPDQVKNRKREVIAANSYGHLEVIEPIWGFEIIGGLEHIKGALRRVARLMRESPQSPVIPKGLFFAGPPGTGKSLMARALAYESGLNMVRMKNIRSMWVGESERNIEHVLDVARALHPVIIFIDELDQEFGRRGQEGDSGVNARLFRRLLEFIGDNTNRGKVLWIVASNRPDLIDEALFSRFDMVFPFLLPDRRERQEICLEAMPRVVGFQWEQTDMPGEDLWTALEGFSGREMEIVVRRAVELAADEASPGHSLIAVGARHLRRALDLFMHSYDRTMYRFQTLLAIRATNFKDFLPAPELLPGEILNKDGTGIDPERLDRAIAECRAELVHQGRLSR